MCPRVVVILIFLCHGGEGVQNRSELAARCEVLLGEETTTTTTMWFATPSYRRTLELHPILLDAIWKDGRTMAAEFQSWLQVRVIGIFCGIAIGLPILVAAGYRYSSCFRRWTSCLDSIFQYRLCVAALAFLLLITILVSAFLAMRIVDGTQPLMEDVQEYYLSSMTGRLINEFILESYRFSELGVAGTGTKQMLASQLCNPTDAPYKIHRLDVDARLQDESFLEGSLRAEVLVPPSSVAGMVLEYIVVRNWQPLVATGLGVVINSAVGNMVSTHRATMQVSFIVRTVCTIRNTDVHLGIRANFPFLLAKLPEVWRWNETYYRDKYEMQSMLYEAVLAGAAQEAEQRQLRLLEWDSLDVGGELMIWVYGVVICCSAAFVISLFMLMLIALKSGISRRSCCCCRCRRLPVTEPAQLQGVCSTSVYGQRLEDICVEVAAEDPKPKPHLTKSISQNLSPKQAPLALPVGQRHHTSS